MSKGRSLRVAGGLLVLLLTGSTALAQITTGTVTGTVNDAQGAVVPGASVFLVSETKATRLGPQVTNGEGVYVFPNITADTYTVEVTLTGFKTTTRKGVNVSGGQRASVTGLVLEAGGVAETVDVKAEAPLIQSATGERSFTVERDKIENLPVAARGFTTVMELVPGVSGTARLGGGGQTNYTIDGISAMDTGNNGLMGGLNIPIEAVSEVRVLTSGMQAEFGRSTGLQVSAVTRSGSNQFRGSVYDIERNSDWNENSWANKQRGLPKNVSKSSWRGYTIGGPVGKPGGNNKLFFFYSQEFVPSEDGNDTNNFRFPTALERRGDFSQTLDNNGAPFSAIYNPATGLPKNQCSATVTTACFQDGGVVGRIPISRLYGPGLALLNHYPLPNVTQVAGQAYNYTLVTPVRHDLSWTPTVRGDYQFSQGLRISAKWTGQSARVQPNLGSLPGYTDTIQKFPLVTNVSTTVNYSINNSTFLEATYGWVQNRLGTPPIGQYSNRNNIVCPADLATLVANCTMGAMQFLFPDAGIMDPRYYEYKALQQIGTPLLQDGRIMLPPQLNWAVGGTTSRLGNAPPSVNFPGFMNINRIQDVNISLTKIKDSHTFKAGFYLNHSYKAQNQGGNPTSQGTINFGPDTNSPIDAGYPFANASLGVFSTFGQSAKFVEGSFLYNGVDFYIQDNWKMTRRLTLDYGMRFVHQGPQYDQFKQTSNFFIDKWSLGAAPFLYQPGCVAASPCSGTNRQAKDPRTGQLLGAGTSGLIGQAILGSGDGANGMRQAGDGIADTAYTWPALAFSPRFGMAYDVSGNQKFVLRGSLGLFYDRPDGNTVFSTVVNPPTGAGSTSQWGSLADLNSSQLKFGPVPTVRVFYYDSDLPSDTQWNGGVQMALPWQSSLDFEYVGHHQFNAIQNTNVNTIDLGTTTNPANFDPTQTTAGTPLTDNILRPIRGYGDINIQWGRYDRTYHSLQSSFNRRFRNGFSFGFNWTIGLSDKGDTGLPGPILRLNHKADGTYEVRPDQEDAIELFGDQGLTRHIGLGNFVWDLPDIRSDNNVLRAIGLIANDWQLSGIFRVDSGGPYDVDYTYQSGGGTSLTGSPNYSARVRINGNPTGGCSSNQYKQFETNIYSGPLPGSVGLESGRNYLHACGNRTLDLAINRTIRLGGGRQISLRADVYNAPNSVIYNGRQSQVQFVSPTDQTVRNPQYLADGSLDPNRLLPNQAGFGAVSGARNPRTIQLRVSFSF